MGKLDDFSDFEPNYEDLERIKSLNFSHKSQRRIGALLIEEFVRTTLYHNGVTHLGFHSGDNHQDLETLWGNTLARLKALDDMVVPEEYDVMSEIKHYRSRTSHRNNFDPPATNLENLVEVCFEWGEWLTARSREYSNTAIDPTPQEELLRIAREQLYPVIKTNSNNWYSQSTIKDLKSHAIDIESNIELLIEEEDEVSTELISEVSSANSIKTTLDEVMHKDSEEAERQYHEMMVDSYIEEHRLREYKYE